MGVIALSRNRADSHTWANQIEFVAEIASADSIYRVNILKKDLLKIIRRVNNLI